MSTAVPLFFLLGVFFSQSVFGGVSSEITLDARLLSENHTLKMVVKEGEGRFDNALAMDVHYSSIEQARASISSRIHRPLDFFKGWNPSGEAHVTVITPLEYFDVLKKAQVSMKEIGQIASEHNFQASDLTILGIGRGELIIEGIKEETYFVIVESRNLRKIRQAIYDLFVAKGGDPKAWNPQRFFPHITIGYTKRDLHEADGVLKNMEHTFDPRFVVKIQ